MKKCDFIPFYTCNLLISNTASFYSQYIMNVNSSVFNCLWFGNTNNKNEINCVDRNSKTVIIFNDTKFKKDCLYIRFRQSHDVHFICQILSNK